MGGEISWGGEEGVRSDTFCCCCCYCVNDTVELVGGPPVLPSIAFSTCLDLKNKTSLRTFPGSSAPYPSQLQEADGREVGRSQGEAFREAERFRGKKSPLPKSKYVSGTARPIIRTLDEVEHCPEAMRGTWHFAREIWKSFQLGATRSPQEGDCA